MALQKQTIEVPLGVGVETKADPKVVQPGSLLVLENGEFDETGAISKRNGYAAIGTDVIGGSTPSAGHKLFTEGQRLLSIATSGGVKAFYQYTEEQDAWSIAGQAAYPGVVRTRRVARATNDSAAQIDVAVCNNYALYAWDVGSNVYHTLVDTNTNATVWASSISGTVSSRPRLTSSGNYIYLVYASSANVRLYVLDTSTTPSLTTFNTLAATLQTDASAVNRRLDVASLGNGTAVLAYRTNAPAIKVQRFNQSGTIATSLTVAEDLAANKSLGLTVSAAGDCYVAYVQTGTSDLRCFAATSAMASKFAPVTIETDSTIDMPCGVEVSTNVIQWVYNCTVTAASYNRVRKAQVDSTGSIASAAEVAVYGMSLQTHPFVQDGRVYAITNYNYPVLGGAITAVVQPTYFLMDITSSNSVSGKTAGRILPGSATVYSLAGVFFAPSKVCETTTGVYLTCLGAFFPESRFVNAATTNMAHVEMPVSIELDFTVMPRTAEIDNSVFVTGMAGQVVSGGVETAGSNFQLYPQIITTVAGASGAMSDGSYQVCAVYARFDGNGALVFSAPSVPVTVTLSSGGANQSIAVTVSGLRTELADYILLYCTAAGGSTFYEVEKITTATCSDAETATITTVNTALRILYTNGGVLENGAPPCFTSIVRKGRRLYGVTPDALLCYTKEVVEGEAPSFVAETLVKRLLHDGGRHYELAEMDGNIIVAGEHSIQVLSGEGLNDTGSSDTLSEPRLVASDTGIVPGTPLVATSLGVMFQSRRGLCLLTRSLQVDDRFGMPVEQYNDPDTNPLISAVNVPAKRQVRFGLSGSANTLVFDYGAGQWSVFTNHTHADAVVWDGNYCLMRTTGTAWRQNTSFTDGDAAAITMTVETPWLRLSGLQGYQKLWYVSLLGEYRSSHTATMTPYFDYGQTASTAVSLATTSGTSGDPLQFRSHVSRPCQAVKFRISDSNHAGSKESFSLTGLALELGGKGGIFRQSTSKTV